MKILFKNGTVLNVFTEQLQKKNVLIENGKIIGVGDYTEEDADICEDITGKILCPGFIDGHVHIESSMLTPQELARVALLHGTTAIVADPHEITNVCGTVGIDYMLESSKSLPLNVYLMIPSCVPATDFDESGAVLDADNIRPYFHHPKILGLAEMMNYVGVINNDKAALAKISQALSLDRIVDGHAPLLTGKSLDKYIASGIYSDHETSSAAEAIERIEKGQWVMIREGTNAKNLNDLLPVCDKPYCNRAFFVSDDIHADTILAEGHIDRILRRAIKAGKSPEICLKMASFNAAQYFKLNRTGAIVPGYKADFIILNDLNSVDVNDVWTNGKKVVENKKVIPFEDAGIEIKVDNAVHNTVHLKELTPEDFNITCNAKKCRVIKLIKNQVISDYIIADIDFTKNNGIDVERDILKLAVIERHNQTGHKGLGFINGIGLKRGAIASTVSHDSHNLVVAGTNDSDMAFAANELRKAGGGLIYVIDGKVISKLLLPVAGLISEASAIEVAEQNIELRESVFENGASEEIDPFMAMSFVCLPVIPKLKLTTLGLVDVEKFCLVDLAAE